MILAGFAEREYTPAEGAVPGQIDVNYAVGKITPLMAHAAVIESDGQGTVLLQLDILFVTTEFASKLRRRISELTGYPYEQIMVNCSHTHTGCAMDCDVWAFHGVPENVTLIEEQAIAAVQDAYESRREVKLGVGIGYDQRYHFCRDFYTTDGYISMNPGIKNRPKLLRPYAAIDHSVNVMRIDDLAGTPKCFIVNYANHLDTNPSKSKFDADFPGHMRAALQKEYGEDVVVLFLNGCCANINHYDYWNGTHVTGHCRPGALPPQEIGNGLAKIVLEMMPDLVTDGADIHVQGKSRTFLTTRRRASLRQIEWAKDASKKMEEGETLGLRDQLLVELYLSEEACPPPTTTDFEISVLQIGPWTIVGLPGEIYSDIGLKIKASSPFSNTIVVEIANGYNGYVSPDIIQRSGCYEGLYSNVAYTGLGTDRVLIDGSAHMLEALFNADNIRAFGALKSKIGEIM